MTSPRNVIRDRLALRVIRRRSHTRRRVILKEKNKHRLLNGVYFLVAGVGLEPHDLRVMSPTSCQLLYPAIYKIEKWCRTPGSNRYGMLLPRDFKSRASAYSATPAHSRFSIAQSLYHAESVLSIPLYELFRIYAYCTTFDTVLPNIFTPPLCGDGVVFLILYLRAFF